MSAATGFLPNAANNTAMVVSVSPIAISGDAMAMTVERSARRSSTSCMTHPGWVPLHADAGRASGLPFARAPAHQQPERFASRCRGVDSLRKTAMENHCDAVGNFLDLVEILT